jgi:hypothetical protein
MLNLFISFLLMLGVQFTETGSGQVKVTSDPSAAMDKTRASEDFERLGGEPALDAIVVMDGTDGKE